MNNPSQQNPTYSDIRDQTASHGERFALLFAKSQPAIFGYILSQLPKWSDAEDVLQQTSVVLWQKLDQFDGSDSGDDFARWACGIARNKVLNYRKKQGRDKHLFSDKLLEVLAEESLHDIAVLDAERHALAGCLNHLSQRSRELVRRCYEGTRSTKEVAIELGRTPNSLYKALNKIREQLLRCILKTLTVEEGR